MVSPSLCFFHSDAFNVTGVQHCIRLPLYSCFCTWGLLRGCASACVFLASCFRLGSSSTSGRQQDQERKQENAQQGGGGKSRGGGGGAK